MSTVACSFALESEALEITEKVILWWKGIKRWKRGGRVRGIKWDSKSDDTHEREAGSEGGWRGPVVVGRCCRCTLGARYHIALILSISSSSARSLSLSWITPYLDTARSLSWAPGQLLSLRLSGYTQKLSHRCSQLLLLLESTSKRAVTSNGLCMHCPGSN